MSASLSAPFNILIPRLAVNRDAPWICYARRCPFDEIAEPPSIDRLLQTHSPAAAEQQLGAFTP